MGRVVLVTGVSRELGGRLAQKLVADPTVDRVVGVDAIPPRRGLSEVQFVRADIRSPEIATVIAAEDVDTVVHLGVLVTPGGRESSSSMKEINVIGSMQLLAACQRAPALRQLVVKSSGRVYGSSPRDPAMFSEEMPAKQLPRTGFGREAVEVEGYVRGFSRRRPDVAVTTLRCANLIGPSIDTILSRYFQLPVIPTVLGFDARLQFLHEDDAVAVLAHAVAREISGTFNVAGDGLVTLSQCVRRLGRPRVTLPRAAFGRVAGLFGATRNVDLSQEQAAFLSFGRALDTSAMRQLLGFQPAHTTEAAFEAFVRRLRPAVTDNQPRSDLEDEVGWPEGTFAAAGGR